jgi:sugar phosphate isomerase/epimerase
MKLAVSNIAFAPEDRAAAYGLLHSRGITGLEIAPRLFFDRAADPFVPTPGEIAAALTETRAAGLQLVSMQSLLFNVQGAAMFGTAEERDRFRVGMERAILLAGRLGVPNMVFGSPRQRVIPPTLPVDEAYRIALDLFFSLGEAARLAGTRLGVEFNPVAYGTNFLNTAVEASAFVETLRHPAVTLILDIGAMHMNGEFGSVGRIAEHSAARISHVHVSEPDLAPAPATVADAVCLMRAIAVTRYRGWYSIEMKAVPQQGLRALQEAVDRLVEAVGIVKAEGGVEEISA